MKSTGIHKYLSSIPLSPEQLYENILRYKLNHQQLRESGFPMNDPQHPEKVALCSESFFSNSQDPAKQICRCGKIVSLLEKGWYEDDAGCSYHFGKRIFCDGPENGLFTCCKRVSQENGCMQHKYHVSSFRPVAEIAFIKANSEKPTFLSSPNIFALDCEMVFTAIGMEVVKVSVVSMTGKVVYHSFVQPESLVLDFNTAFSGVYAEDLDGVVTTLPDVQASLLKLLNKDSILIGHGLENDLLGLRLLHENIVDTSIVYAHERGFPMRHSLKHLAYKYLNKTIHVGVTGHNSVEDAKISMELMLHKIYTEAFDAPLITEDGFAPNYGLYFPLVPSAAYRVFTHSSIPKPMHWPNFWKHGFHRGRVHRNGYRSVGDKYIRFETPIFPVVPPPIIMYPLTGFSDDSEHQQYPWGIIDKSI